MRPSFESLTTKPDTHVIIIHKQLLNDSDFEYKQFYELLRKNCSDYQLNVHHGHSLNVRLVFNAIDAEFCDAHLISRVDACLPTLHWIEHGVSVWFLSAAKVL